MSDYIVKLRTGGHSGRLKLAVEFIESNDTNLVTYVHRSAQRLSEESFIWRFTSKEMMMHPKRAFDPQLLTKEQQMRGLSKNNWQPDFLFVMFTSKTGTAFNLTVTFVDEKDIADRR